MLGELRGFFGGFSGKMRWDCGFCKTLAWLDLLFLFCVFFSVYGRVFSGEVVSEREILLEFKSSVSDPYGVLSSWSSENLDHCSWAGISCDSNSRVSSLKITGGGGKSGAFSCSKFSQFPFHGFGIRRDCFNGSGRLVGELSPVVSKLTELRIFSLPFHEFSGEIPNEIWGLEKLEVLDLEGNAFTGNLPGEFSGLRKLQVLNLGFNIIAGEIPFSLSKCVNLRILNLAGNEVNGRIPGFIGSFPKLQGLYLSHNGMIGTVPVEIGNNCWNLEHIDLSGNFLVGVIPQSLGNCRRLRTLLLFSNKFDDVIPRELGHLRKLEVLDLSRNSLSGPIPSELGDCVELSILVLTNLFDPLPTDRSLRGKLVSDTADDKNHFQGSIPMEITTLPKLRLLWAPRATLEGKFPSNWGTCSSLEMVSLAQNHFTGAITGVFASCKNLHFLDLSSNRLTGELDEKLPVPCMNVFDVSGNFMSGPIPYFNHHDCLHMASWKLSFMERYNPSLGYLSFFTDKTRFETSLPFSDASLAVIHNFGQNQFTGQIPLQHISLQRLRKQTEYAFLAGGNRLFGSFPGNFFGQCNRSNGLLVNVSNNRISGVLETGTMCRSLKFLDVSKNQISGSIPRGLGDLQSLIVLDLSGNKLQGQIPVELGQLKYLKYLSLAGNNLTGGIPSSFKHVRSLEVLELSSNSLSGEIPQGLVELRNLTVLLLNNNELSGPILSDLTQVKSLSAFNASFNDLSGRSQLDNNVMLGSPSHHSGHRHFLAEQSLDHSKSNGSSATPLQSSSEDDDDDGLSSIEIASIISASAIFSVLVALLVLFFYTRKWIPKSRVQGSETREITVFTDIGVPLTFENIAWATGNFNASNCIGNGGFGATYKAEISPGALVAVKRLAVGRFTQGVQQFHAEVKTLGRIRHPNLVTLIGYHASKTEMFLIYNYLPGGNLENFIQERSATAVNWKILHKIALHIASALAYLHDQCSPRVLHRDVKPSNILLDNDFNAYLSDFGLSRLLGTSETHATTGVAGTFGYVAPEYAMTCRVSEKADVYSYGVVLLELISDKKALDPSFSSHANGFNIVSWACMLLRQGQAKDVFNERLWDSGPHDNLVDVLHLAVMCTVESFSIRPTMKRVVQRLKQLQPPSN